MPEPVKTHIILFDMEKGAVALLRAETPSSKKSAFDHAKDLADDWLEHEFGPDHGRTMSIEFAGNPAVIGARVVVVFHSFGRT